MWETDQKDDVLWFECGGEMFDDDIATAHKTATVTLLTLSVTSPENGTPLLLVQNTVAMQHRNESRFQQRRDSVDGSVSDLPRELR